MQLLGGKGALVFQVGLYRNMLHMRTCVCYLYGICTEARLGTVTVVCGQLYYDLLNVNRMGASEHRHIHRPLHGVDHSLLSTCHIYFLQVWLLRGPAACSAHQHFFCCYVVCHSRRCGTAEGLDAGRHCLQKWGFRRVEDLVWIKTNKERNPRTGYLQAMNQEPYSILTHTKEHCLMGMKGSLRRNQDGHVIHANCDTDIIVSEEPAGGSTEKPVELYQIIERFCLGKRLVKRLSIPVESSVDHTASIQVPSRSDSVSDVCWDTAELMMTCYLTRMAVYHLAAAEAPLFRSQLFRDECAWSPCGTDIGTELLFVCFIQNMYVLYLATRTRGGQT